jgi:hypothetical protein
MTIVDVMNQRRINRGTIKLVGFETDFFKDFKCSKSRLEKIQDSSSPIKKESSHGPYRIVLTEVEPTLEGKYQLDVYDSRKNPSESTAPKNLRARKTFEDPRIALDLYEAIRRRLPYLD